MAHDHKPYDRKPTYVRKHNHPPDAHKGRKIGSVNKTTKDVREVIARIAEKNVLKFQHWLDRVAVRDPAEAAKLLLKAIEYHIPKLARTEVIGSLEVTHKSADEVRAAFNVILAGHGEKVIGSGATEAAAADDYDPMNVVVGGDALNAPVSKSRIKRLKVQTGR